MSESVFKWIKAGLVESKDQQFALQIAGERPTRAAWLSFAKTILIFMGLVSLAVGVVFFFAYNWNEMGRGFKFMTLQVILVALFGLYIFKAKSRLASQAILLSAVVVLGALLALFGQTYQTGADPWQLFATWAVLIVPLVLFSRAEILWVVLALLLNTALSLYLSVNRSFLGFSFLYHQVPWLFLILNAALLACTEWLSGDVNQNWVKRMSLQNRWAAQMLGLAVLFILSVMGMESIWGRPSMRSLSLLFYLVFMLATFVFYRYIRKDLLLLTAWSFALIVFILTLLADSVFSNFDAGGLLLMAISLVGMSTFAVSWIKKIHAIFTLEQAS